MASVDDIFKKAGVPSKRKLEPIRDPNEVYKSAKLSINGGSRRAQVEAAPEEDDGDEAGPAPPSADGDGDFGPELPPDGDNDDGDDNDEEGRFFGGGITKQESEVLDFVEEADAGKAAEKIDAGWLRKTALNFEKRITKNAELRAKHEDDPQKFISSEADLDADIKALSILSEHPELYEEFVKLGCVDSLVGLLAHENTDIAIDALEIIGELTDEDVPAEDEQWNALADALIDADLLGLLVSNFSRLNEDDEADRNGVYYALGVLENLCSRASTATRIAQEERLLQWLLQRAQKADRPVSQNKQYAAEILAILAQASPENRRKLAALDAVDLLLQLAAAYRRLDPAKGSEEEEYMENLFEALTCLVDEPHGKTKLVEAEGVELCLIMLKEGKMSKPSALRLLDHATGGDAGTEVCQKLVDAGGLKTLFTFFMKTQDRRLLGNLLSIFASMLRHLPASSAERIRMLAKFVEKDYEKTVKLVELRRDYSARVRRADTENAAERQAAEEEEREELEVEWLTRRLDAGLFSLQSIDVALAWLVAEDSGARARIKKLLAQQDETLASVRATLTEQLEGLNAAAAAADGDDGGSGDSQDVKDMLGTLAEFLQ